MTQPTPPKVAETAIEPAPLPLDQLTLIGLISGGGTHVALLRNADGEIARVEAGDTAFGLQITAIDDKRLLLQDARQQTFALVLPAG